MKILILDVYPKTDYKISKDQNGGYGTANNHESFTLWQLFFKHNHLSKTDVSKLLDYSYKNYYTNLGWIMHFFKMKIKEIYENLFNRA